MPRRRQRADSISSLPLGLKVFILAASLLVGELFIAAAVWISATFRLTPIRQTAGVHVDLNSLIPNILPLLVVAGFLVGVGFYSKVRRWLDDKISRCG